MLFLGRQVIYLLIIALLSFSYYILITSSLIIFYLKTMTIAIHVHYLRKSDKRFIVSNVMPDYRDRPNRTISTQSETDDSPYHFTRELVDKILLLTYVARKDHGSLSDIFR